MRTVNYQVVTKTGKVFNTTSYFEAIKDGNRIIKTYFTPIEMRSEKARKKMAVRSEKVKRILAEKRG